MDGFPITCRAVVPVSKRRCPSLWQASRTGALLCIAVRTIKCTPASLPTQNGCGNFLKIRGASRGLPRRGSQEIGMRRAFVLLALTAFLPTLVSAATCQPWRVVLVYPRVQEARTSQRAPTRPVARQARVCPPDRPQAAVPVATRTPPVQPPALQPCGHGHRGDFVSGSGEKPEINEYEIWKQTEEGRRVHEKWKRRDQDVQTRKFLFDALDGVNDRVPRTPDKTGAAEESE